jgi:hypothetical protein
MLASLHARIHAQQHLPASAVAVACCHRFAAAALLLLLLPQAGKQAILHALEHEHSTYEHATYYPVAVAADDRHNTAFVGVAWEYKNVGPLRSGAQPSGK